MASCVWWKACGLQSNMKPRGLVLHADEPGLLLDGGLLFSLRSVKDFVSDFIWGQM